MLTGERGSLVDTGRIYVKAGNGGNGAISFRREKYVPFGGPDGGDGGNGGHVFFFATTKRNTLVDFRRKKKFLAENGEQGAGANMYGKNGNDMIIEVPVGTIIYDADTEEVLGDLSNPGDIICVARGGSGGRGNVKFTSSVNQAPKIAESGVEGEEREIYLELKMLADVALIGVPNVGKSTIISRISNAKPKIANYHFTTLVPNLGVVMIDSGLGYIVADVPGLIKGAHQGTGLGHSFLRHVERCRILVHVLDIAETEGRDFIEDYYDIRDEIKLYNEAISQNQEIVVGNKADVIQPDVLEQRMKKFEEETGKKIIPVSAVTGMNLNEFKTILWNELKEKTSFLEKYNSIPKLRKPKIEPLTVKAPEQNDFSVTVDSNGNYVVDGPYVKYYLEHMRNQNNPDRSLIRKLEGSNLTLKLLEAGIQEGDTVIINGKEYEFEDR